MVCVRCIRYIFVMVFITAIGGQDSSSERPDLTTYYDKDRKVLTCVAGTNARNTALNFNAPLNSTLQHRDFKYSINEETNSFLDCHNTNSKSCTDRWLKKGLTLANSGDHNTAPVVDERWNNFKMYRTTGGISPYYEKICNIKGMNFHITVSVRTTRDAQILLCDESYNTSPKTAPCYWIMIGAAIHNKNMTAFRKCVNGVPDTFPKNDEECGKLRAKKIYDYQILQEYDWLHYTITREDKTIYLRLGNSKEFVLQFEDATPLSVNTMYFRGYSNAIAEWKMHEYQYFSLLSADRSVTLLSIIADPSGYACISMYVLLCPICHLELVIESDAGTILKQTVKGKAEDMLTWQYVLLEFEVHKSQVYTLYVRGTIEGDSSDPVWAIDYIRKCDRNETRIGTIIVDYSTKVDVTCQSLRYPRWTFVQRKRTNINDILECPTNYTGTYCNTTCTSIGLQENCDRNEICTPTHQDTNDYSCTCAAGYSGRGCNSPCSHGSFGYNCANKCGSCKYGNSYCLISTGFCLFDCESGYLPPMCKETINPYLVALPKVILERFTSVTIEIDNITISGKKEADTFQIQYKTSRTNWITYKEKHKLELHSRVTVKNLQRDTMYELRVILYASDGQYFDNREIPTISAATTCNESLPVHIKPSKRSADLLVISNEEACDTRNYYAILNHNNKVINRFDLTNNQLNMTGLQPYTKYELIIRSEKYRNYTYAERFQTYEDAPSKVVNLKAVRATSTSFILSWEDPLELNGIIRKYTVLYKLKGYVDCSARLSSSEVNRTISPFEDKSNVEIGNLYPYAIYEVSVMASTIFDGPRETEIFRTDKDDFVADEELPVDLAVTVSSTYALVQWTVPNCDKIKGPLIYNVTYKCIDNDWCTNELASVNVNANIGQLRLDFLIPFSHYKVIFRASRGVLSPLTKTKKSTTFNTSAEVPPPVRDLVAYSRNDTTISIRWRRPYPPHGYLEKYELAYCYHYYVTGICYAHDYKRIRASPCDIWDDYMCFTIKSLFTYYYYQFFVKAKNQNVSSLSKEQSGTSHTSEAPSAPPINLTSNWDRDKLKLFWNHPIITNGQLNSFLIKFRQIDTDIAGNRGGNIYAYAVASTTARKTYSYEIEKSIQYSSSYEINVCGRNKYNGENATIFIQTPPETPELTDNISLGEVSNTTVVIKIPGIQARTRSRKSYTYVIVGESESNSHIEKRATEEIIESLKFRLLNIVPHAKRSWFAGELNSSDTSVTFIVGDERTIYSEQLKEQIVNFALKPLHKYHLSVIVTNIYRDQSSPQLYQLSSVQTAATPIPSNWGGLYGLVLLLLLPVVAWFLYRRYGKKAPISSSTISLTRLNAIAAENQYEPDVIPLTTPSAERELKPKRPVVSPKPSMNTDELVTPLVPLPATKVESTNFHSRLILLNNLEQYIREALESGELAQQHALFPRGQTKPWDYGLLKPNKFKNRYNNLIAYDYNRVKLQKINNDQYSDYINANYIHGYKQTKAYIATQGPKLTTVKDFWRMIWQEKIQYIVMLANVVEGGKKKCEQYWPDVDACKEYGDITITFVKSEVYADYEYRIFNVTREGENRKVKQLHFTAWPDHGVPLYPQSLVPFLRKILTLPQSNAPVVIHCSAGVGRTGTIILCDICLRMAAREGAVDILRYLHELREQRANMVDNIDQYKLVHMVLMECLLAPDTTIPCTTEISADVQKLVSEGGLQRQLNYLQQTAWQDQALNFTAQKENNPANDIKNRFKDIVPVENRVYISRYPVDDENADYINAVPVDGFRFKEQFIVTQNPLPNTVPDFWRMILEKEVKVIISLNNIPLDDKTCCIFWPNAQEEIRPIPNLLITHHKSQTNDNYNMYSLILHDTSTKEAEKSVIQLVQFKHWDHKEKTPNSSEHLIMLWEETEILTRGNSPMVVTCHDGATASGLFVALTFVIEKIKLEQLCDVCLAVRVIRRNRKQFVTDKIQFEFLYRAAVIYLSMFETYSNFQPALKK